MTSDELAAFSGVVGDAGAAAISAYVEGRTAEPEHSATLQRIVAAVELAPTDREQSMATLRAIAAEMDAR